MASTPLPERGDIHKSCKAIEGVVNLLNDYCDAATAIVAVQRKLAKAMRDAAAVRCTSETAINALTACAVAVEALVEVDSKFTKLADKECDSLSTDVKKWFKSLAKEERAHDAKVAAANGKIKQAGQNYEKRVKKNPANVADEHARYINLLGQLGPEISQEKYQHATSVFSQQTTLILGMAVSVCRIVDAEWLRACEEVRQIAPSVGRIGEWKALCEGGWTGPMPVDLPDLERDEPDAPLKPKILMNDMRPEPVEDTLVTPQASTPAPQYASRAHSPAGFSPVQPPTYFSPEAAHSEVQQSTLDTDEMRDRSHSVNSIASLGSFPSPPAHFPIPPMPNFRSETISADVSAAGQQQLQKAVNHPPLSESPQPTTPKPSVSQSRSTPGQRELLASDSRTSSPVVTQMETAQPRQSTSNGVEPLSGEPRRMTPSSGSQADKTASSSSASSGSTSSVIRASQIYKRGDYFDHEELGTRSSAKAAHIPEEAPRTSSPLHSTIAERRDMQRSNSNVSFVREKFARATAPASPPPKDIPRLPLSVSNLATRYESVAETSEAKRELRSPVEERRMSADIRQTQDRDLNSTQRNTMTSPQPSSSYSPAFSGPSEEELARRRQRMRELEELELREQEHELRMKQRDIEQRSQELARDRQHLMNARAKQQPFPNMSATSLVESPSSSPVLTSRHPFPSSSTQSRAQFSPSPSMGQRFPSSQSSSSQPSSPSLHNHQSVRQHPDTCGCEACSVSKYNNSSNSRPNITPTSSSPSLRPTDSPVHSSSNKVEKPRGWIRRLSMPVMGNAFSSDSKKGAGISSANYTSGGAGAYGRNSMVVPDEDGRLRGVPGMVGDPKNRSVTNLASRR